LDKYLKEYLDLQFFSQRLIRTAAYVRVSHEEQKKHGFSVEAQKQGLQKYANEKGYIIVEWYIDEAKSARKKSKKREELMRLVEDAKQKKFEMIIFKCIDRWFRNIQEYYKIQEVLEDNKIIGSQGVELINNTSLAVDKKFLPLGFPIIVNTDLTLQDKTRLPFNKIMITHDTGSAIKGVVRGDIFFGDEHDAEEVASYQYSTGQYYILLPLDVEEKLLDNFD
jgi:3D (Asp-Asp-Asp) domain-containing protein